MPAELSDECKRCLQHERVERDLHLGAQLDAICGLGVDDSGRELMRWWACQPMAIPAARHEQQVVKEAARKAHVLWLALPIGAVDQKRIGAARFAEERRPERGVLAGLLAWRAELQLVEETGCA